MKTKTRLEALSALCGPSGSEESIREFLTEQLKPFCDEVRTDAMGNLIAVRHGTAPKRYKLLLDAHMDEVGFIVTGVENGFLRFAPLGGIDVRILPGARVRVLTAEPLLGIIDTMPPHVLKAEDMEKALPMEDLVIDIGMTQTEAESRVPLGSVAVYDIYPTRLQNGRLAGKCFDNRACVEIILRTLEAVRNGAPEVDLYCLFSTQEELGTRGAAAGVYGIDPELALVLDVTHAKTPDAQSVELMELGGGPAIGVGPNMSHKLTERLIQIAKEENIPYQLEVMPGSSGTDAWPIQIARGGVCTGVLSVPLRYMHTPNEVIDLADVDATARLVTAFVRTLGEVLV